MLKVELPEADASLLAFEASLKIEQADHYIITNARELETVSKIHSAKSAPHKLTVLN